MNRGEVWLLAGASGTGKTTVAYPLAHALGVPLVEIDDIVEALLAVTSPDEHPVLHYWQTHPEAAHLPPDGIVELQVAVARALVPAVEAVIANHLDTGTPVLIEGDYLLPSTAVQAAFAGRSAGNSVLSVVLVESDASEVARNFRLREPGAGEQTTRAEVSRLYGDWLTREALAVGVPVVTARPWETAEARVRAAFERAR